MKFLLTSCLALVCSAVLFSSIANADVYELKNGGQIVGTLAKETEDSYEIKTSTGALITLTRQQVSRVVSHDKKYLEYLELSRSMPDTPDAHRMLIQWCKESKLSKLAAHHNQRLLELDPHDEQARMSLGYQQHQGKWLTQDQIMAKRGMARYDGAYRTAQDIALREATKNQKTSEAEWTRQVRLWRKWLNDRRSAEAAESIANITDPNATEALIKQIERERDPAVRVLLLEALAELKHPAAVTTLVNLSLYDDDRDIRLLCIDKLIKYHQPVSLLPYVKTLKHRDNLMVNRAGEALQELGNLEALSPLIDAVVTTHKHTTNESPGGINASFSNDGGGGFSSGGGPKVVKVDYKNLEVRRALVELSDGLDFEFDEKAWRHWYVNQQNKGYTDTRRDK